MASHALVNGQRAEARELFKIAGELLLGIEDEVGYALNNLNYGILCFAEEAYTESLQSIAIAQRIFMAYHLAEETQKAAEMLDKLKALGYSASSSSI